MLTETGIRPQILIKFPDINCHQNIFNCSRVVIFEQADRLGKANRRIFATSLGTCLKAEASSGVSCPYTEAEPDPSTKWNMSILEN
jgi:hypothetical protein